MGVAYLTVNGGIDYYLSEDSRDYYLTISIHNSLTESANIELGADSIVEQIVSSTGNAGIELVSQNGRVGGVVSISKIPQKSDYIAILKVRKNISPPVLTLISAPSGFFLTKGDAFRGRVNYWQLGLQGVLIFGINLLSMLFIERQKKQTRDELRRVERDFEEKMIKRDADLKKLEDHMSAARKTVHRTKLFSLTLVRNLDASINGMISKE